MPNNKFSCDETGRFYKAFPEKMLALSNDPCHGGKHNKDRVIVIDDSNMSSTEKLLMLAIGKLRRPRCPKKMKSMSVWYESNKKAWVT